MRRLVVAVIMTLLLGTTAIAYAGVGACKHCYCPEFMDRGDGICDCGHGAVLKASFLRCVMWTF